MKAVVIVPPIEDFYFTRHRFSALGAWTVVNLLKQSGFATVFFNFPLLKKNPVQLSLPPEFNYLQPLLIPGERGRLAYFTRFQRFGAGCRECAGQVAAEAPQLICLSVFAFCYAPAALELAAAIKEQLPGVMLIAGGSGVTAYPQYFLRQPAIDLAVAGEAEASLPCLLAMLKSGCRDWMQVPNLYFRKAGRITAPAMQRTAGADELSFTWRKTFTTKRVVYIATSLSRGCPRQCRFCVNYGRQDFTVLPFARIAAADACLRQELGGEPRELRINFEDDNLLCCREYFFRVLARLRALFPACRFYAENGIDYTLLDGQLAHRLMDAGLAQFNISLASLAPRLLAREGRAAALDRYHQVLAAAAARQVPCITYFICGFRHETRKSVAAALTFLAGQQTLAGISLFYPVPGLPDFRNLKLFDDLSPRLCLGAAAYPWNGSLSTAELVTAFRLSRLVNLLKTRQKTAVETRLLELIFRERALFTLAAEQGKQELVRVPGMDEELVGQVLCSLQQPAG